jgi:UDP-N-acetylmuramoyl-tripeptide--D-alanyl-D-alanine ligase
LISGRSANVRVGTPSGEQRFVLPFAESYNVTNALAAIAIGVSLGADLEAMARRAADITFSRLRGEHHALRGGITLVNDCYNANPISMHAALESLAEMPGGGRKVAILGGMAELGPDAATYHREIGSLARGLGIGPVVGVGELARDYAPDEWAPDPSAAVEIADGLLADGDVVLVKGSRSVGLEHFSDELIGRRGDD